MHPSRKDLYGAGSLAALALAGYAGFLSKAYVFEGLIRAMPIEAGRFAHLFPGNYLLYGPLGLIFHTLLRAIGIHPLAVTSLQMMDSLLGAAGAGVFFFILRRLGAGVFVSWVWSAVLAFSLGYWLWSSEAEDYMLSTFLLLVNFYFLMRYRTEARKDPVRLGILHGLAILGHIVNAVFAAVILWVLVSVHRKAWRKPALLYAGAAGIVAGGAYGVVLAFIQKPSSALDAWQWFLGSAGTGGPVVNLGGGPTAAKMWLWLKMTEHIFCSSAPMYADPPAWSYSAGWLWGARLLLGVFGLVLFVRWRAIWREQRVAAGACAIWLVSYACVFTRWQPGTMVYRVSDLVPLCLLLFLGYQAVEKGALLWRFAAAGLAVCLVLGNFGAEIYPRSFAGNNPHLARMAFLKANTHEGDWVTGDSGQDEIYIPYFAERNPIVIARYAQQPGLLAALLDRLLAHRQTVYVTSRVLGTEPWESFFKQYTLARQADGPGGFVLYRLERRRSV